MTRHETCERTHTTDTMFLQEYINHQRLPFERKDRLFWENVDNKTVPSVWLFFLFTDREVTEIFCTIFRMFHFCVLPSGARREKVKTDLVVFCYWYNSFLSLNSAWFVRRFSPKCPYKWEALHIQYLAFHYYAKSTVVRKTEILIKAF